MALQFCNLHQSCIAVQNWIEVLNSIQFFPWTWWSIQVQFIGQKLNLNCCSTHHWTFLNWVQSQFRESGVPPTKKGKELQNFVCHDMEKAQFLLFSTRGHSTLSELTLNSVQKSSMVSWAAVQVQFLSNELNLNWPLSSMPWTELELNFLNFIQLWSNLFSSMGRYYEPWYKISKL